MRILTTFAMMSKTQCTMNIVKQFDSLANKQDSQLLVTAKSPFSILIDRTPHCASFGVAVVGASKEPAPTAAPSQATTALPSDGPCILLPLPTPSSTSKHHASLTASKSSILPSKGTSPWQVVPATVQPCSLLISYDILIYKEGLLEFYSGILYSP